MNIRIGVFALALFAVFGTAEAQRLRKKTEVIKEPTIVENFTDSLQAARTRIDSLKLSPSDDSRFSMLFTPLTFFHAPANHLLRLNPKGEVGDSLGVELDRALMDVYLKRPDLVQNTQTHLDAVGAPIVSEAKPKKNRPDIVDQVAPKAIEPDAAPTMDILVMKPNFWTIKGDYYLQ